MKKFVSFLMILVLLLSPNVFAYENARMSSPVDDDWHDLITDATAATANPYNPGAALAAGTVLKLSMQGYTNAQLRIKRTAGQTITTSPKVRCYKKNGNSYQPLKDSSENWYWNTFDEAATDVTNGTYSWTASTEKIDCLGAQDLVCVVDATACVVSSGICGLEASRY